MKKIYFLLILVIFNSISFPTFAKNFQNLIDKFKQPQTQIGISIYSTKKDQILFEHNSQSLLVPASILKLITSIATLKNLGVEYTYKTKFGTDSLKKGIATNLYIKASGDPMLNIESFWKIANEFKKRGVKKITGALFVDDTIFDTKNLKPKSHHTYSAVPAAFSVNSNVFSVSSVLENNKPQILVEPNSDYFDVKVLAHKKQKHLLLSRQIQNDESEVLKIIPSQKNSEYHASVTHPLQFTTQTFLQILKDNNILVKLDKISSSPYNAKKKLFTFKSKSIRNTIQKLNKESSNFHAEMLTLMLGKKFEKGSAKIENGANVLKKFLLKNGFSENDFQIVNGSGYSRKNKVSAQLMTEILKKSFEDQAIWPDLYSSLSIAGVEGTLKNRFTKSNFKGVLRAKTGTLSDVSSLSGVLPTHSGDILLFTIIVNSQNSGMGRYFDLQEKLLSHLYKNY